VKILNVNAMLDPVNGGGTAERTFQMSRTLAERGERCATLSTDVGLTPERVRDLAGVEVVVLPSLNRRFFIPKFSYWRMKKLIGSVDVIHLMGHWTVLNALVYLFARRLGTPYVVCSAGILEIYGRSMHLKRLYNRLIGRRIVRDASGHIAVTADEIPAFRAYGIDEGRVRVIPNGIDQRDYLARDDEGFRAKYDLGDAPFVLFLGRLSPEKGPDLLLEAFSRTGEDLAAYHLVFAGPEGRMLPQLKKMVAEAGIEERVHFIGYVGGDSKSQAYHAADILVVPSRHEAMSIVALEAGITGTPVMLTDRCGFDEVEGVGGGRVVPTSVAGLQTGLVEMLRDPAELSRMGDNLRTFVKKHFAWEAIVEEYLDLYATMLRGKGSA
jgi:glycosyltransferase involved in cell wall biosynthesis